MLTLDEARSRLLAGAKRTGLERAPLVLARGRVLAEDLTAPGSLPPFSASAMDGYAVACADFQGEGPWELPVVGESQTGHPAPPLSPGTACRIFTGAELPAGADAVVMQENVTRSGDRARFGDRPVTGAHVRRKGEDLVEGTLALRAGTRLGPAQLAFAAMLDRGELALARRPVVTILSTGDELRMPGSAPRPASIPESNGVALSAMVSDAGGIAHLAPIVSDDARATAEAITLALCSCDVLVTVGGVSVGDHDVVRPALEKAGVSLDFWKVAIKPGKPLAVGQGPSTHVLGLPGNPASALVTFGLFGVPLLRAMQGDLRPLPPILRARLTRSVRHAKGRMEFLRAELVPTPESLTVRPFDNQASGALTSFALADALAIVPAEAEGLEAGTMVDVIRLSDL
jgi:molybdopterin molybdotransferase